MLIVFSFYCDVWSTRSVSGSSVVSETCAATKNAACFICQRKEVGGTSPILNVLSLFRAAPVQPSPSAAQCASEDDRIYRLGREADHTKRELCATFGKKETVSEVFRKTTVIDPAQHPPPLAFSPARSAVNILVCGISMALRFEVPCWSMVARYSVKPRTSVQGLTCQLELKGRSYLVEDCERRDCFKSGRSPCAIHRDTGIACVSPHSLNYICCCRCVTRLKLVHTIRQLTRWWEGNSMRYILISCTLFALLTTSSELQWRGQPKISGGQIFDFKRATVFGWGTTSRSTKRQDTLEIWGHGALAPPTVLHLSRHVNISFVAMFLWTRCWCQSLIVL